MKKIMSMILSLTIVLGLITPVQATETLVINNENEETIHLEDIVDSENIELDETSELINKDTEVNLEGIDKTVDDEKAHSEESTDTEVEDKELDTPSYTIDGDMENYLEEYLNSLNKEESNADLEIDSEMEEYLNSLIIDEQLSEEDLEDGMYTADFTANKTGTSDSSSMAKYIDTEKSRIKIKNGKITVQDDEDEDGEDETATDTSINDNGTIKDPQNDIVNAPPVNTNSQYKKTTYRVNNEIITESSFGYQAARGAVNKVSYYEIIDDKKYITLGFSQTDIMNNIRLSINGKQINYDVVSKDDSKKTLDIRFEVPSISTQVTVTTNVTAMGRDISFGVEFLESTLELISTEEAESLPELAGNSSGVSESNSSGSVLSKITNAFSSNKTNSEDKLVVEEEAAKDLESLAKEYFKKYTVTNEIVSDSAIGRTMARKYLNQTSIIEDIDGQLYATITFSSSGSMGDFKIEVNGEVVEHTVPLNDMANELISLRFPINNVNDDIKAYIYINPMRMNINFGIKFLEDSMILIEEGTVGEEGNIESSSLADTLSQVNESSKDNKEQTSAVKIAASTSVMVIVLNQVISALGVLLKRIKAKSLLRKIAEK